MSTSVEVPLDATTAPQPVDASLTSPTAADDAASSAGRPGVPAPIVTVIELDSDEEMKGEPTKARDEKDEEGYKIMRRALQNGKMSARTSEWHFVKGLIDLSERCTIQHRQIRRLQSEKEELNNKLLKQALDALGRGFETGSVPAHKYVALQEELEEARKFKTAQNNCILELNGKLAAVQQTLQVAEDRLKTPATEDAAAVQLATLHQELSDKAARIKKLEASAATDKRLAEEKDVAMQRLADQLAVSSQLEGPIHSKTHLAEIETERERADAAEARLEEALKVKKIYEQEVMALEAAKEELDERWLAQSDELRKVRADLEWAENEKGELEEDLLEIMRQSGKSAMDAFQEQNDKIAQLTQELASTQELLDNAQHELMDDANDRDRLQEKNDILKSKFTEATKKLATETRQSKAHQNRIAELEAQVRTLEDQTRAVKRKSEQSDGSSTRLQELQDENDYLTGANKKATRVVDDLKRDISDLTRQIKDLQAQLEASRKAESAAQAASEQKLASSLTPKQHRTELFKVVNLEEGRKKLEWEKDDLAARMGESNDADSQVEMLRRERSNLTTKLDIQQMKTVSLEEKLSALNEALEREKELTQSLDGLVTQLRASQAKPGDNGATASQRVKNAPVVPTTSSPAVARAPTVASSATSKPLANSSPDQSPYAEKAGRTEEKMEKFAATWRKKFFFKPGQPACVACKRLETIKSSRFRGVAMIEGQKGQLKHIINDHDEELRLLRDRIGPETVARTGSKRAASIIDVDSPKRLRAESQEISDDSSERG